MGRYIDEAVNQIMMKSCNVVMEILDSCSSWQISTFHWAQKAAIRRLNMTDRLLYWELIVPNRRESRSSYNHPQVYAISSHEAIRWASEFSSLLQGNPTWSVNIRIVEAHSPFHTSSIKWLSSTTASLISPKIIFLVAIYTCVLVLYFTSGSLIAHNSLLAGRGSTVLRSFILSRTRFSVLEEETLRCPFPQGIWVSASKPYNSKRGSRRFRTFPLGFLQPVTLPLSVFISLTFIFEQQILQCIWGKL